MTITEQKEIGKRILLVKGRLDTTTSPQLEQMLENGPERVKELILDFASLEYISSAGLRVLLIAHKKMEHQEGKLIIRGINQRVREVFTITGFMDILYIE